MNTASIIAALAIGTLLGAFYFGGLWFTVSRLANAQQPALLFFVSFLVRTGGVLLGFYFVADGRWERLVACMAGFLLARSLLVRRLRDAGRVADPPTLSVIAKRTTE